MRSMVGWSLLTVLKRVIYLGVDILPKVSSGGNVQHLAASAYGEYRFLFFNYSVC